ncbi:MAG: serine/threonine protein kinase [Proteobacteria bacterium]|nr:serine/threonine protein kinase [Pseudomonadota bacterium]
MEATPTLRDLFEQALALPPAERARLLDRHCADPARRAELERMLAADANDDDLPGAGDAMDAAQVIGEAETTESLPAGSRIGPFELLEVLGEGGSSTVFRAFRELQDVRQYVAVKLLARGLYTDESRRRFRHEREALARLRHPGIARLIEGGVADNGLAYIALELIDGAPITRHAQEHDLPGRERLLLFLQVCRAVESAHRALIVHRDLKPSNVLVNADGEVKLLDFGIAKLLDDGEDATRTRHQALTPAYAAPEQFTPGAITTATDVYALGILLRELLTDERAAPGMMHAPSLRMTGNDASPPAEPTAIPTAKPAAKRLRGDLANIVAKATEPEPERRYGSAGALAEDIERHLDRLPVRAHPPSRWYRAGKFVARHRGGVALTAALLLAIFVSLSAALWQAHEARQQAWLARQQATRANMVRDFLESVFESARARLPRDQRPTPEDLVKQSAADLMARNGLPQALRADLLLTLARVAHSVGSNDQAMQLLDSSAPIIQRLYGPTDAQWWDIRVLRGMVLEDQAHYPEVLRLLQPLRTGLLARRDPVAIDGLVTLGNALLYSGRVDEGLATLAEARVIATQQRLPDAQLTASIDEASALLDAEHFRAGLARADATLALWRSRGAKPDARIVGLYEDIALGAEASGDIGRADFAYRKAIDLGDRFYDKPNPDQAWNVGMYGTFLVAQGRLAEAEPYVQRGLELRRQVFGDDHENTLYALAGMGKLRDAQGRHVEAIDWYTQGIASCQRTGLEELVCPRLLSLRAFSEAAAGRFVAADADIRSALDRQRALGGDGNANFAYPLEKLAAVRLLEHRYADAIAGTDRVLAIYATVKGGMIQRELNTRLIRAQALFALERNADALRELLYIEPKYAAMFPQGADRFTIGALEARALAREHRDAEAALAACKALALVTAPPVDDPRIAELRRLAASR